MAGYYRLKMIVSPGEVGPNNFMLYVEDTRSGQPATDFKTARLQYTSGSGVVLNFDLETIELPVAGMDCAVCTVPVQKANFALPGIDTVKVLLSAEKAISEPRSNKLGQS